jgi:hypothetical protein
MGRTMDKPNKPRRMSPPLSRSNQTRLLRSLNLRATAGDGATAEAFLRLGIGNGTGSRQHHQHYTLGLHISGGIID